MEQWDQDYVDLVEPGYIELNKNNQGEFVFGTVKGFIDYRTIFDNKSERAEFSWEGTSEYDPVCGRGWVELSDKKIYGMLFFHNGDESWIKAVRK